MKSIKANIGDKVWFANGKEDLSFGTVILSFLHYKLVHYVIEVETGIDPVYSVRDEFTISDAPDQPLGFWRRT